MPTDLLIHAPQPHTIGVLVLTVVALVLFTRENISLETSSFFVLCMLVIGFQIFPYVKSNGEVFPVSSFFLGFGNEALVAVCALMIAGQALVRTGATEPVGRFLAKMWGYSPSLSLLMTLIVGAVLSAFINNTPIVVLLLPVLINVSLKTGQSPSGTLMPMGLATLLGGMSTTIGTSTNLLVVQVAEDLGVPKFDMFDFALPVIIASALAILYLWLVAPLIIPERLPPLRDTSPRVFTAELKINEGSYADGKTLAKIRDKLDGKISISRIVRGDNLSIATLPDVVIYAGDRLLVTDTPDNLREYEIELGASLYTGRKQVGESNPLSAGDQSIAELVITSGSLLDRVRVGDARLESKFGLTLLAIHSQGKETSALSKGVNDRVIHQGDVLLVQGSNEAIKAVKKSGSLLLLDGGEELPHTEKAPLALAVMATVVALAAFNITSIAVSATVGCFVLIATGCLRWHDATRALSVQVILIIVASLALGSALMTTGGADFLANVFVVTTHALAPGMVLGILMLVMAVLTNVVSNNATAVIGTPIAVSIAQRMGMPVEPFVLAVLFGANLSYVTPMAYKTNLLVMNAGGYKFNDFVRVGLPLAIIMWLSLTGLLTWIYQLY